MGKPALDLHGASGAGKKLLIERLDEIGVWMRGAAESGCVVVILRRTEKADDHLLGGAAVLQDIDPGCFAGRIGRPIQVLQVEIVYQGLECFRRVQEGVGDAGLADVRQGPHPEIQLAHAAAAAQELVVERLDELLIGG